jgi:hypothetical protein
MVAAYVRLFRFGHDTSFNLASATLFIALLMIVKMHRNQCPDYLYS